MRLSILLSALIMSSNLMAGTIDCTLTVDAQNHIVNRHCRVAHGPDNPDQFQDYYCSKDHMVNLCKDIQVQPDKHLFIQMDGKSRFTANVGYVVGTEGQECARVVVDDNGYMVTIFPVTEDNCNR